MVQYMDFHVPPGLLNSLDQLAGPCQFQHREMPIPAQGNANSSTWKCQFQHMEMPISAQGNANSREMSIPAHGNANSSTGKCQF
jgi:hypothetical protein